MARADRRDVLADGDSGRALHESVLAAGVSLRER